MWDWWWFPFDVADDGSTSTPIRPYRSPSDTTPLIEYYFDEDEAAHLGRAVAGTYAPGAATGGPSPSTFRLDPGSPVYSMANGELVAARLPAAGQGVSLSFLLVRHEIFHAQLSANPVMAPVYPAVGRLDYAREPSFVYTLYMHLGGPVGASLPNIEQPDPQWISTSNPDWLNRVLKRLIECDAGLSMYGAATTPAALRDGIADSSRPPGTVHRPTILESWQTDQIELRAFVSRLRSGQVAIAPPRSMEATPIKVLLGDFLGDGGVVVAGPGGHRGIRIEAFSRTLFSNDFVPASGTAGWVPPLGSGPHALYYQSEWATTPTPADVAILTGNQIDPALMSWWPEVAHATMTDASLPPDSQMDVGGWAFHFQPSDILRWINDLTWRSEWLKYRVTDDQGNDMSCPVRPRSRRV